MKYNEIKEVLVNLDQAMYELENAYIENGGECDEQTEKMEEAIDALKELLTTDGVDSLGRWLKSKEDRKKTLKAEKDFVDRQIKANDHLIDFIKTSINRVMSATGQDKLKGSLGYSFASYTSSTVSVDNDVLNDMFGYNVHAALDAIIPADVTVKLGASVKMVPEGQDLPAYYQVTEKPSVRFTKPRAAKDGE